jgi:hypothetical protein
VISRRRATTSRPPAICGRNTHDARRLTPRTSASRSAAAKPPHTP